MLTTAIIVAGVLISASLFVAVSGPTKTVTTTTASATTETIVSTTTATVTSQASSCSGSYGGGAVPGATSNFTTSCQTGLTLSVASDPDIPVGTNQTIYVSLQNHLPSPQTANSSGSTNLPPGLDSQLVDWEDVQPQLPQCGAVAQGYIVIYNESGSLLMLQDEPDTLTQLCDNIANIGATLNPYQTVTVSLSFGGYWTSADANEPWINATYRAFSPGEYTIVAFDSWGQLTKLSFTVTSPAAPVTLTTSNADWRFEVHLSAVPVSVGQPINYTCYLTNISGQNQTVDLANPISNPSLYTQGGKQVWGWQPSAETNAIEVVPAGETLTLSLNIPTSGLQAGQTYVLSSSPNISTAGNPEVFLGQSLELNATIQIIWE